MPDQGTPDQGIPDQGVPIIGDHVDEWCMWLNGACGWIVVDVVINITHFLSRRHAHLVGSRKETTNSCLVVATSVEFQPFFPATFKSTVKVYSTPSRDGYPTW